MFFVLPYPSKLGKVLQFSYGNLSLMISFPPPPHAISACGDVNNDMLIIHHDHGDLSASEWYPVYLVSEGASRAPVCFGLPSLVPGLVSFPRSF